MNLSIIWGQQRGGGGGGMGWGGRGREPGGSIVESSGNLSGPKPYSKFKI